MSAPQRLPRGSHGLTREQVAADQRARLLRAIAEATAEHGYARTSVAEVLRRAGVGRETFYELFDSKEDCFIAAYESAAARVMEQIGRGAGAPGTALERFERVLGAYLDALAAEPEFARLFMIEVYAAGERVLAARLEVQRRFVELVARAFAARPARERFACEALVAAITTMVTMRLAAGDVEGVRALRAPLVELVRSALARRA